MARQWTTEQRQAITARGGDLLVSASAGSGKTAVLTERVIETVVDPAHPVDIDRLLVVTFTKAAAAEMRGRISERLSALAALYPQEGRIARQQLLLDSAEISTIHAFCISLIRSDYAALGLPADLRVADDREMDVLRARVMGDLLAQGYAEGRPEFLSLVALLTVSGREDDLAETVGRLYDFARNRPFYRAKLAQMARDYAAEIPFDETKWCAVLLAYAGEMLDYAAHLTEAALALSQGDPALEKAYVAALSADLEQFSACRAAVTDGGWDHAAKLVSTVSFAGLSPCRADLPQRDTIKKYRAAAKDAVKALKDKIFLMDSDAHAQAMQQVAPAARELFALVARFDELLAAEKLERSVMDFGDLEHFALALLYNTDGGEIRPSARAADIAARFDAVLVDEYQDVSEIQEMLFRALKASGAPLFMVGDVKQSVYRFREARPDIFLQKKRDFVPYNEDTPCFPARISLGANFRTRAEITGFINSLFSMVMSPDVGGMSYTTEDALLARADYDYTDTLPVQLCVIDHKRTAEAPNPEAAFVAAEIRRLLDAAVPVRADGGARPLRPGDICILLRSGTHAREYLAALEAVGVSCWLDRQSGILQSREAACVVSFLKLLVNPMLDLELAAVLASPMYSLNSEELAQLRLAGGRQRLFTALSAAGEISGCVRFLTDYRKLRFLSAAAPVGEVVRAVCAVTGLSDTARAISPEAETNLHLLSEYAAAYEARGDSRLSGFVDYLYALEEYGYELPSASTPARDAVAVMSIHRSKGLEFPVVFLSDCAAKFPFLAKESRAATVLNPTLGFGCVTQDMAQMRRQRTLPYIAIQTENARSSLSEELCILYVAMTRARERLYLTASDPGLKKLAEAADVPFADGHIDVMASRQARCLYDWIAPAAVRRADFDSDWLSHPAELLPAEGALRLRVVGTETMPEEVQAAAETPPEPQTDAAALAALETAVQYEYPYKNDLVTPEKVAVSALAERAQHSQYVFARRPKLLSDRKLTPAERGVAAHKFMQFADFAAAAAAPEKELRRLLETGFLEQSEADCIELAMISAFFASPLGQRVLHADCVYREIRFIRECTPQELHGVDESLTVPAATVVQGVADCVILEGGRGTVIDYKTDILKQPEEFIRRYRAQLRLYRFILRDTLALPVEAMSIYSFYLGREIPL